MTDREKIERAIKLELGLPEHHVLTDEDGQRVTTLYLWGKNIVDVGPLASLTALMTLDLRGNEIVDVGPLASLTALTTLYLWDNEITHSAIDDLRAALPGCRIYA
uniref:Leucine-rich repeat domain-containing protein n=1 Tax=viral metagenome TaxID=1070528 RepID=A0A6H1Z7X7_9ZZZZ